MPTKSVRDRVGVKTGEVIAPVVAAISHFRRARMFHPDGVAFHAHVSSSHGVAPAMQALARSLEGSALVRFSGALWRRGFEHLDVLGVAIRFREAESTSTDPSEHDQDLLFATIRSPFTMGFAPFTTTSTDYLDNTYWAVSPFEVPGGAHVKFRLVAVPSHADGSAHGREDRLVEAVVGGGVRLQLEARPVLTLRYAPLVEIALERRADIDQEALRFSPFRSGRGVLPKGLVHAMRRAVYPASQRARPSHQGE